MKLRLNKLMAGLVLAGGALALVGCGGGDTPTLVVNGNAKTTVSAAALPATKAIVNAASGVDFNLPTGLSFPNSTSGGAASTPASTVLEIVSKPNATGNEFAGFSMSAGPNDKVEGVVETGSCKFKVTNITGTAFALLGWKVGDIYTQSPCELTLITSGTPVGSTVSVPLTITLGTTSIMGNASVEVLVAPGEGNTASVSVGGTVVTEQPLPTGGTPN